MENDSLALPLEKNWENSVLERLFFEIYAECSITVRGTYFAEIIFVVFLAVSFTVHF